MTEKLPLDAKVSLIAKMVDDLEFYSEAGPKCPSEQNYKITASDEGVEVEIAARMAAFKNFDEGIRKVAFDTRRIDQERDRNPRRNLQEWHRAEKFIDDDTAEKLEIFAKLESVVSSLKEDFDAQPEWFDSYVRMLSTNLDRLRMKRAGDKNIEVYKPHVSYLEQLIYNRYRLTLKDIKNASEKHLRDVLLSKDEELKSKGEFLKSTGGISEKKTGDISKEDRIIALLEASLNQSNPSGNNSKDALGELFGGNSLRRAGEKSVERTITITIKDNVVE